MPIATETLLVSWTSPDQRLIHRERVTLPKRAAVIAFLSMLLRGEHDTARA